MYFASFRQIAAAKIIRTFGFQLPKIVIWVFYNDVLRVLWKKSCPSLLLPQLPPLYMRKMPHKFVKMLSLREIHNKKALLNKTSVTNAEIFD